MELNGKIKAVDLFCGCGGLSCGFAYGGFNVVAAYDNWDKAIKCYNHNIAGERAVNIDLKDIKATTESINLYNPRIIIGSPPCQEFSNAGRRKEGDRADLTYTFAEIIKKVSPEYFVMENVPSVRNSMIYAKAKSLYAQEGYGITEVVLDACNCEVPQHRKRFFCIGAKNQKNNFMLGAVFSELFIHTMSVRDYFKLNGYKLPGEAYYRHPTTYSRRAIFSVDEISPTIRGVSRPMPSTYKRHEKDAVNADKFKEVRALSVIERAHIQTFPINFNFDGLGIGRSDLDQMIGNAVPVRLAEYVARCLSQYIIGDCKTRENNFAKWLRIDKKQDDKQISATFINIKKAQDCFLCNTIDSVFMEKLQNELRFKSKSLDDQNDILKAVRLLVAYSSERMSY